MTTHTLLLAAQASLNVYHNHTYQIEDIAVLHVPSPHPTLAIRGTTKDPRDWFRDADLIPTRDPNLGLVHRGFRNAALIISSLSQTFLTQTTNPIITGHSMGAAIALLTTAYITLRHPHITPHPIAFAPPRTGSKRLASTLSKLHPLLFRYGLDPVPDLPFLPFIYQQPTPLIDLPRYTPEPIDPFEDHHMNLYLTAIQNLTPP